MESLSGNKTARIGKSKQEAHKAFTIVELLIVIVVIAILAAVSIVAYRGIQGRAIETTLKSDLSNAATQLGLDKASIDAYPLDKANSNDGKGLITSPGISFTYDSDGAYYCLTATSDRPGILAHYVSNSSGGVQEGACPGHPGLLRPLPENGGVVTTIAGSGANARLDGVGTAARFISPTDVVVDNSGNVFVLDSSYVRKITPENVVTTFASGLSGSEKGIGISQSGVIYIAMGSRVGSLDSAGNLTIIAGSATTGQADGTGSEAQFSSARDVAISSSGILYVADGHRVRKIAPGGVVTTLAGYPSSYGYSEGAGANVRFNLITSIVVDSSGMVYVQDADNRRVRRIHPDTGVVTSIAGNGGYGTDDGTGTAARFSQAWGLAIDRDDNIYVMDSGNSKVRKVTLGGVVTTIAGGPQGYADGTSLDAQFYQPRGVGVGRDGTLYIADTHNRRIRMIK